MCSGCDKLPDTVSRQGGARVPHRIVSALLDARLRGDDSERSAAKGKAVKQVEVAVIGTGWCGGIRAETLSRSALVDKLHICEIRPDRLAEVKALDQARDRDARLPGHHQATRTSRWSTSAPRRSSNHFPIARDCLKAGKHVLLEKPIALELWEADELITLARRGGLKFTIGYSQRFNTKVAYAKKKITDGTLGKVGLGAGEPPSHAQPRQEDRAARVQALAGGDGIDPRPRFRVLAARAGQAGAGLFAGRLRLHAADQRLLRHACGPPSPWTTACWW